MNLNNLGLFPFALYVTPLLVLRTPRSQTYMYEKQWTKPEIYDRLRKKAGQVRRQEMSGTRNISFAITLVVCCQCLLRQAVGMCAMDHPQKKFCDADYGESEFLYLREALIEIMQFIYCPISHYCYQVQSIVWRFGKWFSSPRDYRERLL